MLVYIFVFTQIRQSHIILLHVQKQIRISLTDTSNPCTRMFAKFPCTIDVKMK